MARSNTWRRPAPPSATSDSSAVLSRLVGFSMAFWVLVGVISLVLCTRTQITPTFRLSFFSNFADTMHTLKVCGFLLLLNMFAGAVCALPAAGLLLVARRPPDMIQRKQNRLRLIQRWIGRAFPYVVLFFSHAVLLSLGLGTAPQWARSLTHKNNPLADYSRFVNELFFFPIGSESTREHWQHALKGTDAPRALVVFAPSSLLLHAPGLLKLKRSLGEPKRFFADSASVPAFFAELFYAEESANLAFHLPVPDAFALAGAGRFLRENGSSLGVEWDEAAGRSKNLLVRFAPEWKAIERVIEGDAKEARARIDLKTAATLRLLQSQVPLFLFARFDIFRMVEPAARWTQLVADDASTIDEALADMTVTLKSSEGRGLAFVHLSEHERAPGEVIPPFSPLRWPATLEPMEERWLINKFDGLLGFGFSVVAGPQAPVVFVVPYPDGASRAQLTHAFLRAREDDKETGALADRNRAGFLTVDDVTLLMRESLDVKTSTEIESAVTATGAPGAPTLRCERHFTDLSSLLSDEPSNDGRVLESYWNAVGRYSGEQLEFPSALSFLSGSGFEHSVICRPVNDERVAEGETAQSWIIRWVRQEESDIVLAPSPRSAGDELRRALVRTEVEAPKVAKRKFDPREQERRDRLARRAQAIALEKAGRLAALDSSRYANYELFRLSPDVQAGFVLRRATPGESNDFFKRWGLLVDAQFEQGARAQLH